MDASNTKRDEKSKNLFGYLGETPSHRFIERCERIRKGRAILENGNPRESLLSHFNTSGYVLDSGRLVSRNPPSDYRSAWIFVNYARNTRCRLWHHAIFDHFGYIPTPCHECFKVVVKPRTLRELMILSDRAGDLGLMGKYGIEQRPFVFGAYSMFFYARGLEQGQKHYLKVKEAVNTTLSSGVPVILKRGCTRYELESGPSDSWRISETQMAFETFLKEAVSKDILDWDLVPYSQNPERIKQIKRIWIGWAYHIGDSSYLEFTGGQPLFPQGTTYQQRDS